MKTHPGGAFVMSCMVGLDCTTFYVGSSTITTLSRSFKHPPTVQGTLDKLFVGFLGDEDSILKERIGETGGGTVIQGEDGLSLNSKYMNIREGFWEITSKINFPEGTNITHYRLKSKRFRIEWNPLNVFHFGKHVNIYDEHHNKYRPYTILICYMEVQRFRFNKILRYLFKNSDDDLKDILQEIVEYIDPDNY